MKCEHCDHKTKWMYGENVCQNPFCVVNQDTQTTGDTTSLRPINPNTELIDRIGDRFGKEYMKSGEYDGELMTLLTDCLKALKNE